MKAQLLPEWLCGTWSRNYIRRADKNTKSLGAPDSSVDVTYIQTPWAFVDVRRSPHTTDGSMSFAGITTVRLPTTEAKEPPLVRWHACLDMTAPFSDTIERWNDADEGRPRETEDEGYFEKLRDDVYRERDPGGNLEEEWVRVDDGGKKFLVARRGGATGGGALLVVAGDRFGLADQMGGVFVAGF